MRWRRTGNASRDVIRPSRNAAIVSCSRWSLISSPVDRAIPAFSHERRSRERQSLRVLRRAAVFTIRIDTRALVTFDSRHDERGAAVDPAWIDAGSLTSPPTRCGEPAGIDAGPLLREQLPETAGEYPLEKPGEGAGRGVPGDRCGGRGGGEREGER